MSVQSLTVCTFVSPPSEQGTSLSQSGVGAAVEPVDHAFLSSAVGRWLNVILDLNGILCVCLDRRHMAKDQVYNDISQPHSSVLPAVVGPKAVYVRPHCLDFLRELSLVAYVSVWSSMATTTTKLICEYLFRGLQPPLHIMGQDSCDVIKYRGVRNKLSILKVKGTNKDLFLKPLDKLFEP